MKTPKAISDLIDAFQSLPGIGPKSAQRLTFHLLHFPQEYLERFAGALVGLKINTKLCMRCKNVGEEEICSTCLDNSRDQHMILVVSNPMDAFAIQKTGFKGVFHVLHGLIDPLNSIGPDEIFINELLQRLKTLSTDESVYGRQIEIIMATNTSMEGESTAMYISKVIRDSGFDEDRVKISRIARGLPVGGDIEYTDEITLSRALDGRGSF